VKKPLILRGATVSRDIAGWYEELFDPLRGYLCDQLGSAREAEEIAQEAFLHLWFAQSSGPIENPKDFLFATASNLMKGPRPPDAGPRDEDSHVDGGRDA